MLIRGYLALQLLTLARARAIIAVSQYVHERLTPWQGKTTVVPNAVTAVGTHATRRVRVSLSSATWSRPTAGKAWIWFLMRWWSCRGTGWL